MKHTLAPFSQQKLIPEVGDHVFFSIPATINKDTTTTTTTTTSESSDALSSSSSSPLLFLGDHPQLEAKIFSLGSNSLWDMQHQSLFDIEEPIYEPFTTTTNTGTSKSNNGSNNEEEVKKDDNVQEVSPFLANFKGKKPMPKPKVHTEAECLTLLNGRVQNKAVVSLLFTMKKKLIKKDENKPASKKTKEESEKEKTGEEEKPPQTFDFAEDVTTDDNEGGENVDAANKKSGDDDAASSSSSSSHSVWDFSTICFYEHRNSILLKKELAATKNKIKNKDDNVNNGTTLSQFTLLDELALKESIAQDRATLQELLVGSSKSSGGKARTTNDNGDNDDDDASGGRYLFIFVKLDNVTSGVALPVTASSSSSSAAGQQSKQLLAPSSSIPSSTITTSVCETFHDRVFVGQRAQLKLPLQENETMRRFREEAKISFPEILKLTNRLMESNSNGQPPGVSADGSIIFMSTGCPDLTQKIKEVRNLSSSSSPLIITGTVVCIRRHLRYPAQFALCFLVDDNGNNDNNSNAAAVGGDREIEIKNEKDLSFPFGATPTRPRILIAVHAVEIVEMTNFNNNNNKSSIQNSAVKASKPSSTGGGASSANSGNTTSNIRSREESQVPSTTAASVATTSVAATSSSSSKPPENSAAATTTANSTNNKNIQDQQQPSEANTNSSNNQQPSQFQVLLKTLYGNNNNSDGQDQKPGDDNESNNNNNKYPNISDKEASKILSNCAHDAFGAGSFRKKLINRTTGTLNSALTLHETLVVQGGGMFRRMYGTGVGAYVIASNNEGGNNSNTNNKSATTASPKMRPAGSPTNSNAGGAGTGKKVSVASTVFG